MAVIEVSAVSVNEGKPQVADEAAVKPVTMVTKEAGEQPSNPNADDKPVTVSVSHKPFSLDFDYAFECLVTDVDLTNEELEHMKSKARVQYEKSKNKPLEVFASYLKMSAMFKKKIKEDKDALSKQCDLNLRIAQVLVKTKVPIHLKPRMFTFLKENLLAAVSLTQQQLEGKAKARMQEMLASSPTTTARKPQLSGASRAASVNSGASNRSSSSFSAAGKKAQQTKKTSQGTQKGSTSMEIFYSKKLKKGLGDIPNLMSLPRFKQPTSFGHVPPLLFSRPQQLAPPGDQSRGGNSILGEYRGRHHMGQFGGPLDGQRGGHNGGQSSGFLPGYQPSGYR